MKLDIFSILAIGLAVYLRTITPEAMLPAVIQHYVPAYARLNASTLIVALAIVSILMWITSLLVRPRNRSAARVVGIAAALICGHGALLTRGLNTPNHESLPIVLWALTIFLMTTAGIATREKSSESVDNSATLSIRSSSTHSRTSLSAWLMFSILAVASATLVSYRMFDIPGELNGFGTQAISAANRLLHGEIAIRDLVLYREMTQEECGNSLPYVAWHALFQLLCGGMSLTAARIACATASWLSILMMFRIGRHIGGPSFGLLSMATYAAIPVTLLNARNEGIFGFSALLIMIVFDAAFLFLRRPSVVRAMILGICVPLVGYGIANIKFYLLALVLTLAYVIIRRKRVVSFAPYAAASIGVALLILLPQLLNLQQVKIQVQGRGEHIFGGVLHHLAYLDPSKPTAIQKALEILEANVRYLGSGLFGPWTDNMTSLPGAFCVILVIGLCLIISSPLSPACLFLGLVFVAGYAAPLISIPIGWTRILMLNIAQALVIASVWAELLKSLHPSRFRRLGSAVVCLGFLLSLRAAVPAVSSFLRQEHSLSYAREFIMQQPVGTVVFFTDRHESSGNFLRWNPPYIGRDSMAQRPLIGIREASVGTIKTLVERLEIPATIVSNESPTAELASAPGWQHEKIHGALWGMRYSPPPGARVPTVQVLEPTKLGSKSPVMLEQLAYTSPRLFMTRLAPQLPLTLEFNVKTDLERVAIIARGRNSYSAPVNITVDNGGIAVDVMKHFSGETNSTWFYVPEIASGPHTMTLQLQPEAPPNTAFVDDVVIIGIPRAQ